MYCIVQYSIVQYSIHVVQYCTVQYYTVLHCTVLYCTILYCTVLYCTVLYCTVLYCTVLYCTVLYCTVLYYNTCIHKPFHKQLQRLPPISQPLYLLSPPPVLGIHITFRQPLSQTTLIAHHMRFDQHLQNMSSKNIIIIGECDDIQKTKVESCYFGFYYPLFFY